jgi:hypothetical protein
VFGSTGVRSLPRDLVADGGVLVTGGATAFRLPMGIARALPDR